MSEHSTRTEELAEAIENLCIGICSDALQKVTGENHKKIKNFLADSQRDLRTALAGFHAPALRVVGGAQRYSEAIPPEDRVHCNKCGADHICANLQCDDWHASIRAKIASAVGVDDDEDGPEAA